MRIGARGVISVTANVVPRAMHEVCAAALAGRFDQAAALDRRIVPLHQALFVEPNPIPVKWAAERMGLIAGGIRLPLTPLSETRRGRGREGHARGGRRVVLTVTGSVRCRCRAFRVGFAALPAGEVAERSKALDWKFSNIFTGVRGFESHPLRQIN